MIYLSYQNVEELVFYDKKVQQILPELTRIFNKWTLSIRAGLNSMTKESLLDFLNEITTEQIEKIAQYWGSPVTVQRLDTCIIKNLSCSITDLEKHKINGWNFCISREGDLAYISCWR